MTEEKLIQTIENKRILLYISKVDFCKKANISRVAYDNILKGASPTLRTFLKMCEVMNIECYLD